MRSADTPPSRLVGGLLLAAIVAVVVGIGTLTSVLRTPTTSVPDTIAPASMDGLATCDDAVLQNPPVAITSTVLFACPQEFDGVQVRIRGEAVGDLLGRGTHRWVQVNDDPYAFAGPLGEHHQRLGTSIGVAVLLPAAQAPRVLGGPGVRGDLVEVVGTFRAAAPEDQGGAAVIADHATVISTGRVLGTTVDRRLVVTASLAALLAALVWGDVWRRRER